MKPNKFQINLVLGRFTKVEPISGKSTQIFYTSLFEIDPWLHKLFKDKQKPRARSYPLNTFKFFKEL